MCAKDQKDVYAVSRNEVIHIHCEVDADPDDVVFTWRLNGSTINQEIRSFKSIKAKSIASYSPRNRFGYGNLECWAQNIVGGVKEPCIFQIIPAGE